MLVYDIVIIGGGLVGAGLAAALRTTNLKVALVDARMPQNDDPRLFALNAGSCDFLQNVGVWPSIQNFSAEIREVHVSSRGHFGVTRLKSEDAGGATLGHVIPAHHIESALNSLLTETSLCDIYRPVTLVSLVEDATGVTLTLATPDSETTLRAGIVVGADGAESTVRALAGIDVERHDYEQTAIVTRTTLNRSHGHIAYERFTDKGTVAMLPLVGNECATIWSGNKADMAALLALSDDAFLEALQQQFGYRLGRLQSVAKRHSYALQMTRAKTMAKGRVMLVGNAAHTLHPVAAQGFNLAMYELAVLVEALSELDTTDKLSGAILQTVFNTIKEQQSTSMTFSHRLADWLADGKSVFGKLLPLGLVGLDLAAPLRRRFVKKIMGRTGRVPRLLMSTNI